MSSATNRQIKISVIGRKSGLTISIPVWFVLEGEKVYLLPVKGSGTQWYKNVLQNPTIRIDARGVGAELRATPVTDAKAVKSVVEKFREKSEALAGAALNYIFSACVKGIDGRSRSIG